MSAEGARLLVCAFVLVACGDPTPAAAPPTTSPPTTSLPTTSPEAPTSTPAAALPTSSAAIEPPLPPEPTAPIACSAFDVRVYAGTQRGERLHLTALVSGAPDEQSRLPISIRGAPVDLDGDGALDVVGAREDAQGELECGNWGECVMGAYVRCDGGWAEVAPLGYRLDLRPGNTRTEHAGRRFRVLLHDARLGDDDPEADAERGPTTTALAIGDTGYLGTTRALWFESERCAAFVAAGQYVRARDMCEQGLAAHPHGRVRGALYFDLGRVAEAEGRAADAREAYRLSLEARPGNAVVEARLTALGP